MFEAAELGRKLDKESYRRQVPRLRAALLKAQVALSESRAFAVIVLIGGVDGAGKGETVNTLHEWMDPREIETNALREPTDEERERPPMWRFWRTLPPKGKLGILFGSWYTEPILAQLEPSADGADLDRSVEEINRLEKMLVDEGVLVLKFWFHLSKRQQRKRFKELEKAPATRYRIGEGEWAYHRRYDELRAIGEHVVRRTNKPYAHWVLVEGADARYRNVKVGKTILAALRKRLRNPAARPRTLMPTRSPRVSDVTVLDGLDLGRSLDRPAYRAQLHDQQARLGLLSRHRKMRRRAVVAVFEGNDAAGKGGGDPPRHGGARRPLLPRRAGRGADRGGTGASLPVALLAPASAARAHDDVRPLVVRARARRTGRGATPPSHEWKRAYERDRRLRGADLALEGIDAS